ncbi:MAG: NBR1-Ig-like domain-containing protein [Anaerolineales bacterium]|nr:MAG: NBR1-Ig-like domain-containing protein [Anaerolineales bacterium]
MSIKLKILVVITALIISSCGSTSNQSGTDAPASDPNQTAPADPLDCTSSAAFVADVTLPDYTNIKSGESFNKIWRVKNSGTCTWTDEYSLVFVKGEQMNAPKSTPLTPARPGDMLDIEVELKAPSEDAQYRADFELHDPSGKAMQIDKGTLLWVIVSVGNVSTANSGGSDSGSTDSFSQAGFADVSCAYTTSQTNVDAAIASINAYRTANGLPAYTVNPQLNQAAQVHSADMACNNFFTHKGTNGSTPDSRVAATGYSASNVSENVYGRYPPPTGQEVVTWWATDQSDTRHNANLLSSEFTQIGVGYSYFNNFGYYVVVFVSP